MIEWIALNRQTVPSAGGLVTFTDIDDIRDPILGISICQTGQNVTDEATLSELLAGIGKIYVKRGGSTIIQWDADDLYYYNSYRARGLGLKLGGTADNHYRRLFMWLPMGETFPQIRKFDRDHALCRLTKSIAMEFEAGSDAAAGSDNRTLDVSCLVDVGAPAKDFFLGHIQRDKTLAANEYTDIDLGVSDEQLFDIFAFQTTNIDDGVTSETTTIEEIRILRNKKEEIIRSIKKEMFMPWMIDGDLSDAYVLVDLVPPLLLDVPTSISILSGDAQPVRVYPGILYRNEIR